MENISTAGDNEDLSVSEISKKFQSIFEIRDERNLIEYLTGINDKTSSKRVCGKIISEVLSGWCCFNCEISHGSIICNDCYEKSKQKHTNHNITQMRNITGWCDCGDSNYWDPWGFCPDHQGVCTSDDEIKQYMMTIFDENILMKINITFHELFSTLSRIIYKYASTHERKYRDIICEVIMFINRIAECNLAMLYIISDFWENTFPYSTTHTCVEIDSRKNQVIFSGNEIHSCQCTFLHNLLSIWDSTFEEMISISKVLLTFLKSYKIKLFYGKLYISLWEGMTDNSNQNIRSFLNTLGIEGIRMNISQDKRFLTTFFNHFKHIFEKQNSNKELIENYSFAFYTDMTHILESHDAKVAATNEELFKILIAVMCNLQNLITVKDDVSKFQCEGNEDSIITTEIYLLKVFSLLTTYFDYSDDDKAKEILFHIINLIRYQKSYKKLSENEFSFQIPVNRALAIFLNRYVFFYSMDRQVDISQGLMEILGQYLQNYHEKQSLCEDYDKHYTYFKLLNDLVMDTFKVLGFVNSVFCSSTKSFYICWYYKFHIFYLCDFTLLKLILSQDLSGKLFDVSHILSKMHTDISYLKFSSDVFEINFQNEYDKTDAKIKKLMNKNLESIVRLYRNSYFLLDLLAFSYDKVKDDELLTKIFSMEGRNINHVVKLRIAHIVIGNANSIQLHELVKMIPFYIKALLSEEKISSLISEVCERSESPNRASVYKLKNEFLNCIDLSYIINPRLILDGLKYLKTFKKSDISILYSPELAEWNCLKNFQSKFLEYCYGKTKNISMCINPIVNMIKIVEQNKVDGDGDIDINASICLNLMKILDIYISFAHENLEPQDVINNSMLISSLDMSVNCTFDYHFFNCCRYLYERLFNIFNKNEDQTSEAPFYLSESRKMERHLKFIEELKNKAENENDIGGECCVMCKNQITLNDFFSNGIGKIGLIVQDSFIYHSVLLSIKNEYEHLLIKSLSNPGHADISSCDIKDMMMSYKKCWPDMRKTLRCNSCNHFIHFTCYLSMLKLFSFSFSAQNLFPCPSCSTMSNAFIPHFQYPEILNIANSKGDEDFQAKHLFKGLTFEELFIFSKDLQEKNETGANANANEPNWNLYEYFQHEEAPMIDDSQFRIFIEQILSLQANIFFTVNNSFKDKEAEIQAYSFLKKFFVVSLNLLDILKNDEYGSHQLIQLLKDFILSLRVLIKINSIPPSVFIQNLLDLLKYGSTNFFTKEEDIVIHIECDLISDAFCECLFLILVLFDESETKYFRFIIQQFLPIIYLQYFVVQMYIDNNFCLNTITLEEFAEYFIPDNIYIAFLQEKEDQLKEHLVFYLRKAFLIRRILSTENNKKIHDVYTSIDEEYKYYLTDLSMEKFIDSPLSDYLNISDYPPFWEISVTSQELMRLAGKYHLTMIEKNINSHTINPSLFLLNNRRSFHFVELPPTWNELGKRYNEVKCSHCNTCPESALLCLTCGGKICFEVPCCNNLGRYKNEDEYKWHSKLCGSGDCVYLDLKTGVVMYSLLGRLLKGNVTIYKSSDILSKASISESVLNMKELERVLWEFKNLTYKKYFDISSLSMWLFDK